MRHAKALKAVLMSTTTIYVFVEKEENYEQCLVEKKSIWSHEHYHITSKAVSLLL